MSKYDDLLAGKTIIYSQQELRDMIARDLCGLPGPAQNIAVFKISVTFDAECCIAKVKRDDIFVQDPGADHVAR